MMTIEDIMTEKVISVRPDTLLIDAVTILIKNNFNGLPVINEQGVLLGLLTEWNFISNHSYVHLRTLLKLLNEVEFYKNDSSPIKEDLEKIISMKVSDVMNTKPVTLTPKASIEDATRVFADPKNNPIPVVNDNQVLVGILALSNLTKLYGIATRDNFDAREVDKNIDNFITDFEKKFVIITKFRARTWLVASVLFAIVGFIIAMFFIVRISL